MEIKFFCPYWGSEKLSYQFFFEKVINAGYHGVEVAVPLEKNKRDEFYHVLKDSGMLFISQSYAQFGANHAENKARYKEFLYNQLEGNPLCINSHTGKDYFSFEQNCEYIQIASDFENVTGIPVYHETHRVKFSYAAHITKTYLEKIPNLKLGLDISHWCAVAETFLDDQPEAVELALQRTRHIHARVGFTEGPQIPDPRDPLWSEAVSKHLEWWSKVIEYRKNDGAQFVTITPEFGPFPYMSTVPAGVDPSEHQWNINLYMKKLLAERFANY